MYNRILSFLFIFITASLCYSQSDRYIVDINSFGDYDFTGKTFVILPADKNMDSNDLEFKEYTGHVCKALAIKGAREATSLQKADFIILMHYEITDQSYNEVVSVPVWGKTGISSITTNADSYSTTYGSSNSTSTSTLNYDYGIAGYQNVCRHVDKFLRVLNLYAYENKPTERPIMIWKTNLFSDGYANNIRELIPVMTYAGLTGIGSNIQNSYTFLFPNSSFEQFFKLKIRGNNIYNAPDIDYYKTPDLKIISIQRKPNETLVTFFKSSNLKNTSISKYCVLEHEGKRDFPLSSENIKLGRKFYDANTRIFSISFPAISKDCKVINITEEYDEDIKKQENCKYWRGIHLD